MESDHDGDLIPLIILGALLDQICRDFARPGLSNTLRILAITARRSQSNI